MSRILLDTHIFLWWAEASPQIRSGWVDHIVSPENSVHVSAVTAWEIEIKKRINKLDFDDDVERVAMEFGFDPVPVTMRAASRAGSLEWEHRDPFDRMLVAQAIDGDMVLLSADAIMKSAPGVRVL